MALWIKPSGLEIEINDRACTVKYALELGWKRADEMEDEPALPSTDGDKGWGEPGSIEWHETTLKAMDDKEAIEAYVKDICGTDIDRRGGVDKVRGKAVAALRKALADG